MTNAFDTRLDRTHRLRLATEDRHLARIERLERKATPMVGEVMRGGVTVFYCYPVGGKYFESTSHTVVVDYLIAKKYVR